VLTACLNGYGKRTLLADYPIKNRGGQGVINIKATRRNGPVVEITLCRDGDDIMFITQSGMIVRSPVSDMRPMGRGTQGVRIVNLKTGDSLVAAEVVSAADIEDPSLEGAEAGDDRTPPSDGAAPSTNGEAEA